MITHLFFLILTLLAIDFAPKASFSFANLGFNLIAASILLCILIIQKKFVRGKAREVLCQIELLLFALFIFYGMGVKILPVAAEVVYLVYYFSALGIGHSWHTVRFLVPFTLPFILLSLASLFIIPYFGETFFLLFSVVLLVVILLFTPLVLQFAWNCKPIQEAEIKQRLDSLCTRMKFRHGGMLVWKVVRHSPTAAIIGILPRFRYVLFTEPLLKAFPPEEIEAVLSHEMGHAVYRHLLIYPILFLGLPAIGYSLFSHLAPLSPLLNFTLFACVVIAYIRFFIGFFSRNFEKQADLFVFATGIKSELLVGALHRLSSLNLLPLKKRSWHHGSIQERIDLIERAAKNPKLIQMHRLKLRFFLLGYVFLLTTFLTYGIF